MEISKIYHNLIVERLFKTSLYLLKRELRDCDSVLDLGCGPDSPIQYCSNVKYSVGVEAFEPYLKKAREKGIHNEYVFNKIENLDFEDNSFDAVILIEVLEHLTKDEGKKILSKAKKWAAKKVVVTTPNGFIEQAPVDKNPLQKHLSGWSAEEFKERGFKVYGLAGLKMLRRAKEEDDSMDDNLLVSIKYKPKAFWFLVATFSQVFTYFVPEHAFELFCVFSKNA